MLVNLPDLPDELLRRLDLTAPRYTSYPTVPVWTDTFGHDDYVAALERAQTAGADAPLSIYVHIPFCREMCTFCGCNAIVSRNPLRSDRYLAAVKREIEMVAAHLGPRRTVSRLHLGGGTPTTLNEPQLLTLWRSLTAHFRMLPDAEIALEIDPAVTSREQLAILRGLGFNRVSMGVQDFDPAVQQAVNRIQTVEETRGLVEYARFLGYDSISLDLICGLPKQSHDGWNATLDQVIAMDPDRLAVFSFAFVPDHKPHQKKLTVVDIPTGADKLSLFRLAYKRLVGAGYQAIGLDHFARTTDELAVADREGRLWRDFQGYTTQRAPDTIAFGISGISYVGGAYVQSVRPLRDYYDRIAADRLPVAKGHHLTDDDVRRRVVITEIMCNDGIDLTADRDRYAPELEAMKQCERDGLIELDGAKITLTQLGRMFRRNVACQFDAYLKDARVQFSRTV